MIKKIFSKQRLIILFELLILFAISLTPFNWLTGNEIITGHDTGAPLIPLEHFKDRLFVWTNRWGLSADQTYAVGAFFIHGLEALVSSLGFSLQRTEQINYVFWLFLPGLTMYYFARSVFSNRRFIPIIASVFFMLNHFLLQGWFVTERTKFSTYAVLPLLLLFMFKFFQGKLSPISAGLLSGIALFILNGGGNLPLFGALFILVPFTLFFFTYLEFSFKLLKRSVIYLLTATFSMLLLSSFWLIPYISYILQEYRTEVARAGGVDGVIGWAIEISRYTSFLNLMRLQGIPDWYNNPFHTYSNFFLQNPIMVAISFLIPVLAFGSWFMIKNIRERIYVIFFMFVGLIGMIFTAGMHPPTGFIYELLLRFVPGFVAFRTPFYKFAPLIWLSYSILLAFFFDELLRRSSNLRSNFSSKFVKKLPTIGLIVILFGIISYNYPIFNGKFFEYEKGSMRLVIPDYIFQFREWADGPENRMNRSLLLPGLRFDNKLERYDWGYFSLATLTTLLTRETFMINAYYNTATEDIVLNSLYENLLNNEAGWDKLAALLGIKSFVVRGDFTWDAYGAITRKPEDYEQTLKSSDLVQLNKVFGQWRVYSFKEGFVNPLITTASDIAYVQADPSFTRYLTSIPGFDQRKPLYFEDQNKKIFKDKNFYISKSESIYLLPKCITCDLRLLSPNADPRGPLILPASPLYFIIKAREEKLREKADTLPRKIDFLLEISLRRLLEAKKMIDYKTDENFVYLPLKDHYELIKELQGLLIDKEQFNSEEGNELLIRTESYLDAQHVILEKIFVTSPLNVEKEVNATYFELAPLLKKVRNWTWRTLSEDDKKYIIHVDKEGEYKIWLRRDPLELPKDVDPKDLTFSLTVDGKMYNTSPEIVEKSWLLIKRFHLQKGIHRISLLIQPLELFKGEVAQTEGKIPEYLNKINGGYTLYAKGEKNCVVFPIKNLISGTPYRVSFKHRKISGDQDLRVFVSPKSGGLLPLTKTGDRLESIDVFRDYRLDTILLESNELFINICTEFYRDPLYTRDTLIELQDISVRKLSSPVFVFERTASAGERKTPDISFEKINQTKYQVSIKNATSPFFLNFSQRFAKDWKIYYDDRKYQDHALSVFLSPSGLFSVSNLLRQPLKEDRHFISNVYANTWYLDKEGTSNIILEYRGQQRFYVSSAITIFVLILSIIIIIWDRRKKK